MGRAAALKQNPLCFPVGSCKLVSFPIHIPPSPDIWSRMSFSHQFLSFFCCQAMIFIFSVTECVISRFSLLPWTSNKLLMCKKKVVHWPFIASQSGKRLFFRLLNRNMEWYVPCDSCGMCCIQMEFFVPPLTCIPLPTGCGRSTAYQLKYNLNCSQKMESFSNLPD